MIKPRPALKDCLTPEEFRRYYWLKEELTLFCKQQGIPACGPKLELEARIEQYLSTGQVVEKATAQRKHKSSRSAGKLSLETVITPGYTNSEENRAFFRSVIGEQFHFTTRFMRFCREHPDKTYGDAVAEWHREREERKAGMYKPEIEPQFEYNRFIREYRAEHPDRPFKDAVSAWNEHKQKPKEARK